MSQLRTVSRVARLSLVLACGLAPAGFSLGQGTIAYFEPSEPLLGYLDSEWDVNGDGRGGFSILRCLVHRR